MSKVIAPIRCALVVLLVLAGGRAQAQTEDWHVQSGELFAKSAFAHGYMHGYEEGFHNGDTDVQMGREFRDVKGQVQYKKPVGYRAQFGDKSEFDAGYRSGFLVGYTDCFSGRNFRAIQLLKENVLLPGQTLAFDRNFDQAFRKGYENGQRQGLADGRNVDFTKSDPATCQIHVGHEGVTPEYCTAYEEGYRLGYSDGFANQRGSAEIFARNKK